MAADDLKNKLADKANGNQLEPKKPEADTFQVMLTKMKPQIEMALPKHIKPERIMRIALSAYNGNSQLKQCEPISILAALMTSAQLGLEVNTPLGQAYIIPYKNKGRMQAQYQLGYKGLLDLAYRSGQYQVIYAMEVYENDTFDFEYGMDMKLSHKPAKQPKGEPVYYYAVYKTHNGGTNFRVWSREKVIEHAKRFSQAYGTSFSPWKTNFDSMAKKTVLKDLLKYAPLSIEIAHQLTNDESIKLDIQADMSEVQGEYIDVDWNVSTDTDQQEEPAGTLL